MKSVEMLELIATALGPLREKAVFVGGSAVGLYLADPGAPGVRPTEDVDCVVKVLTRSAYYRLEERLRALGFRHDTSHGAPVCRWLYKGLKADIMPTEGGVLDFRSKWYPDGYANSETIVLPGGTPVRIFSLPYFLASKVDAFLDRGAGDFLLSPDMEDIVAVLDGAEAPDDKILAAPEPVREYLRVNFAEFVSDERFLESLNGNLASPSGSSGRVARVIKILTRIIAAG